MEVDLDKLPSGSSDPDKLAKMNAILSQFTEDQMNRYESFRRSGFQKSNMRKLLASITGSQKISLPTTIVVSGIAKMFVGELIETARIVMTERNDSGPLGNGYAAAAASSSSSWTGTARRSRTTSTSDLPKPPPDAPGIPAAASLPLPAHGWSVEDDDLDEQKEAVVELFGEPWFSKLFRAYGYVLPLLLVSMLVATGPRAFLMAMALPLSQSAISWAVSFFTARSRRQQQSYGYDYDDDPAFQRRREEEDDDYYEGGAWQWQSRSYQQSNKSGAGFGGWDDLLYDEKKQESTGKKRTPPEPDTSAAATDLGLRTRRGPRRSNGGMSRGRSSSRRYNHAPLLTRLLVAFFPFLGSWFRIL
ncbi:hypothetical protein E2562_014615 [Oryza meyeriana var. granulata]|uniref:TAFII28-like protein domain-containing protein n=1 Tax=Oryza meyeriana var. granulata TaxID=110450 RepID=A0A6G1DWT3_9ORYZ|nr:hypothetical protein E2562_014615 [Oryza meyeriana var. granulata]